VNSLQQLTDVLQTQKTLGATLATIAEATTMSVAGCDAATIAISIGGHPATAAMTATVALELDLVQYDNDDGPCLTSFHTASALRIDLYDKNEPFPHIAVAARRVGIRAVLSVPSIWGPETIATLNLYSRTGPFDESAETVARVLATQVAIAVSRSPEYVAARAVVEQAQRNTTTTRRSPWRRACSSAAQTAPASKPKACSTSRPRRRPDHLADRPTHHRAASHRTLNRRRAVARRDHSAASRTRFATPVRREPPGPGASHDDAPGVEVPCTHSHLSARSSTGLRTAG